MAMVNLEIDGKSVQVPGGSTVIGWLKPRENSRLLPLAWTR